MCFEIHHTHKVKLMLFSLTCTNSTRHKGFRVAFQVEEVIYRFCIQYTLLLTLTTPPIDLILESTNPGQQINLIQIWGPMKDLRYSQRKVIPNPGDR